MCRTWCIADQHAQINTAPQAHIKVALPVNYYGEGYSYISFN